MQRFSILIQQLLCWLRVGILSYNKNTNHKLISGQLMETTCKYINLPITIECATQFINGNIKVSLQHENLVSHKPKCQTNNTIESRINTLCQKLNKSDQCEFRVLDSVNGYEECIVINKNVLVTYQCVGKYLILYVQSRSYS